MELIHNPATAVVERGVHVLHDLGQAAVEAFDQGRMVRRLQAEQEDNELGRAVESLEVAQRIDDQEGTRIQRVHILRILIRGTLRGLEHDASMHEDRILLIKNMLHGDSEADMVAIEDIGLSEREALLLRSFI